MGAGMQKTGKRETALALLVGLAALVLIDLTSEEPTRALQWAELFTLPVFGFAVAAFGLDAAAKQLPGRARRMADQDPELPGDRCG